jgi:hypothetical protein
MNEISWGYMQERKSKNDDVIHLSHWLVINYEGIAISWAS